MKITYLVKKKQEDGNMRLAVVSHQEWRSVVDANKGLPKTLRRYFVREYLFDGNVEDCIYIEVSLAQYREWHNEHMRGDRKRKKNHDWQSQINGNDPTKGDGTNHKLQLLSLDAPVAGENQSVSLDSVIPNTWKMEDTVCSQIMMDTLRNALSEWKPWAVDLLDFYLLGHQKDCTNLIAQKYSVSPQLVRKYKKQFENFIKKFFETVSFDSFL